MKRASKRQLYNLRDPDWWKRPRLRLAKVESYIRPDCKEIWVFLILPDQTEVCLGIYPAKIDRDQLLAKASKRLLGLWDRTRNRRWQNED